MKIQNEKFKMRNRKGVSQAIFKPSPLKGGEVSDSLSLEGRGKG
jgi:hypothetical protein